MGELHFALSSSRRREANWGCSFRKFHLAWIRIVRQNHRVIESLFIILHALGMFAADLFKSRNAALS
jgi:hypothetical protein